LSELYEIVVYTAGLQGYADPILNYIDPMNSIIMKRLYRQDCIVFQNDLGGTWYVKDLDVFLDRSKEDIVIVDNSIHSFGFDLDNGVPISSFIYKQTPDL
jgi:TFIIF-interacting CTD phosphatase-like protein